MTRRTRVSVAASLALLVGLCGCRFKEGALSVDASCPDNDGDGACDDDDGCPTDPAKSAPGICGCSQADTDADGDGVADCLGCADGQREGFVDPSAYPHIAACAGGWSVPGVIAVAAACNHHGGDDGRDPSGVGCSAADLCQPGWRVCSRASDVAASSPTACTGAVDRAITEPMFFATGQSGPGSLMCAPAGTNDLFGCGTVGYAPDAVSCAPLTQSSQNLCASLPAPWSCGTDGYREAANVVKPGPGAGGVLCCRG